jgi:hypothetical protein
MPTRVRFRFNKVTGEVEEFLVDDQDRRLSEADHDRIAADVADFVAVSPRIHEATGAAAAPAAAREAEPEGGARTRTGEAPEREAE